MAKPLYPHVPGKSSGSGDGHISADFKNSISKQIVDETQAVKEYKTLALRALNMGISDIASQLGKISDEESGHRQILEEISRKIAGK